jgi:hypothetical protein
MIRKSAVLVVFAAFAVLTGLAGVASAQDVSSVNVAVPANLTPPEGSVLLFKLQAEGVQIYTCEASPDDPSTYVWTFKAPEAELINQDGKVAAYHFAGPTWEGLDGSEVVGAVVERADSPDASSIPWLLLEAKKSSGRGAFSTISYVQRIDTVGGMAPTTGCGAWHIGGEVQQPYEATYAFYYAADR